MPNEPGDSEQQKPSAIDRILDFVLERNRLNQRLHWTTIVSEKTLLAIIGMLTVVASADAILSIFVAREVTLPDLFLPVLPNRWVIRVADPTASYAMIKSTCPMSSPSSPILVETKTLYSPPVNPRTTASCNF
jgi:hypothetical protein